MFRAVRISAVFVVLAGHTMAGIVDEEQRLSHLAQMYNYLHSCNRFHKESVYFARPDRLEEIMSKLKSYRNLNHLPFRILEKYEAALEHDAETEVDFKVCEDAFRETDMFIESDEWKAK